MDSYQAIYDAVRSRISGGNVSEAVAEAARNAFDISHMKVMLQQDFSIAAYEMQRPCVLFKPELGIDGNKWSALYGPDLMHGVCGFGDSPAEAMADFDKAWNARLALTKTGGDLARLQDQLAKLDGDPPHDHSGNVVRGDGIFAKSIEREFGAPIEELRKRLPPNGKPKHD